MDKPALTFHFHDPNPPEKTAALLLTLFAQAPWPQLEQALRELDRVCRQGGRILLPTYMNRTESGGSNPVSGAIGRAGADFQRAFTPESYQDFLDAQAAFPDLKAGTWGGKGEIALFGDLGVPAVDKAVAIDRLLEAVHAKREDTIAFGDAKVDIPMFEYCAIGVAMGSGGEEAKAAADYVTDAVDQDGLYHAFRHFHLIEA